MRRVKSVAVLGATGSIGVQALEIVRDHPELSACALAAHSNAEALVASATAHGVERIALVDPAAAARARTIFDGHVLEGEAGGVELVRDAGADTVLNAIVRAILPVDSEHSAIWQCLGDARPDTVESLVITASGGPFRGLSAADLAAVTPDQALAHPTWSMGAKITIDSATLMNKGLEVIEAHFLFGVPYERIEVAVHPQSIVHAMVRFRDGALLAHLGLPDMRVPISYALTYPERAETPAPRLDLASLTLEVEPPDPGVFRCLALARAAGEAGGTAPCALNAANEVAVEAFLAGGLPFPGIADVVERVLGQIEVAPVASVEQVLDTDRLARRMAGDAVAVAA